MLHSDHDAHELNAPELHTELPGPLSSELIQRDERYTSPSYTRVYPLAVRRGRGAVIEDLDGNRFLDFTAGIAVCSTGHCHPRVVAAIQGQAGELIHMSGTDFYYEPQQQLAERLAGLFPGEEKRRVFFTNSGAESVEAAFKLARYHTRRQHVIAFYGAFHGRTLGALSLTGSKLTQRRHFGPLVPQVHHVDYPYCFRCPRRPAGDACCWKTFEQIESQLFGQLVAPDEVAAIVVEPIQGEGGYVVPPRDFHQRLAQLARKHGILLIADEVQSGMGRTGKMMAMEHFGVDPDITCLAKGIASGMPLGAIVAKESIMDWPPGSHASTYGGNPLACAAALETIRLLQDELTENARHMGDRLQAGLRRLQSEHVDRGDRRLAEVRGLGLMVAVELVDASGAPDAKRREAVVQAAFRHGLLLLGCGRSAIRFCPPLVVNEQQVDQALELFKQALQDSV